MLNDSTTTIATELKPITAEMRAPYRIRLKMSRPSSSVPIGCAHDEPWSALRMCWWL